MKNIHGDIIVWDVDETLGSFATLSDIFNAYDNTLKRPLSYDDFKDILDMFPEYIRPKIFKLLRYLKKHKKKCGYKVVIYTNNMGDNYWIDYIKQYIEEKIRGKIFDDVIRTLTADKRRTTYNKTYGDLERCLGVSGFRHVYFIDDQPHYIKNDKRVQYLQIPPYVIYPNVVDVGSRLINSKIHKMHIKNFPVFLQLLKETTSDTTHFENQVHYNIIDDVILENFVHEFVRKTQPKRSKTLKIKM